MSSMSSSVSRTTRIAAPADAVWAIVSDLPRMGELSPENTGGTWTGGATGPAVGAGFAGTNSNGKRSWSTRATVVRCVPGSAFAFVVKAGGLPVAEWSYDVAPDGVGCTVTETWSDRRGGLIKRVGGLVTGVSDREGFTASSIETTLAALKSRAEG